MTAVSKLMKNTIQANKSLAKKMLTEKKRIDSLRKAVNTGLKIPTTRSNIKRGKVIRRNIRLASPSNAARTIKIPENADYFRKIDATVIRKLPKNNMVRENNTNGRRAFSFNANKQTKWDTSGFILQAGTGDDNALDINRCKAFKIKPPKDVRARVILQNLSA
jgi:hypothetical protein